MTRRARIFNEETVDTSEHNGEKKQEGTTRQGENTQEEEERELQQREQKKRERIERELERWKLSNRPTAPVDFSMPSIASSSAVTNELLNYSEVGGLETHRNDSSGARLLDDSEGFAGVCSNQLDFVADTRNGRRAGAGGKNPGRSPSPVKSSVPYCQPEALAPVAIPAPKSTLHVKLTYLNGHAQHTGIFSPSGRGRAGSDPALIAQPPLLPGTMDGLFLFSYETLFTFLQVSCEALPSFREEGHSLSRETLLTSPIHHCLPHLALPRADLH